MSELLNELKRSADEQPADPLAASIDLLLRRLSPWRARCLRLCAIPHTADLAVLGALIPEARAEDTEADLRALMSLSIIEVIAKSPGGSRPQIARDSSAIATVICVHDAARRYLFDQWLKAEKEEDKQDFAHASARLVDHFGMLASRADSNTAENLQIQRIFHLIGANQSKGLIELEGVVGKLRSQFRIGDCELLLKLAHEYDVALDNSHLARLAYTEAGVAMDRGQWDRAEHLISVEMFGKFDLSPDLRTRGQIALGLIHSEGRRWQKAINHYTQALSLVEDLEDPDEKQRLLCETKRRLAVAYRDSGHLEEANVMLHESLDLAHSANDPRAVALGSNSLGNLYRKLGETQKAIDSYNKSLECLAAIEDRFGPAQVYNNIGLAYLDGRLWSESVYYFQRSLEIKRAAGDTAGQARTLNNLLQVYGNLRNNEEVIRTANDASTLFTEINDLYGAAVVKRNLARLLRKFRHKDEARRYYREALEQFEQIETERQEDDYRMAGLVGTTPGRRRDRAFKVSREAVAISEELDALDRKLWLPWWIWLTLILLGGFMLWDFGPFERFILHILHR